MGFVSLAALCMALFVLTVVSAAIPLHLTLSHAKIDVVSKLACGILLGAALGIVIPEGFNAVYEASADQIEGNEFWTGTSLLAGFALMFVIDSWAPHHHQHQQPQRPPLYNKHSRRRSASLFDHHSSNEEHDPEASPLAPLPSPSSRNLIDESQSSNTRPYSLVLGLLAHSLADGVSLGASGSQSLSAIVFVAIALHKAPTAFALTTLLISKGCSKWFIRHTILVFSLSAPVGAIATKVVLTFVEHSDERLTGLVLCFSGGSFLYVAAETIKGDSGSSSENAHTDEAQSNQQPTKKSARDVVLTIAGMALPIFLGNLVKHGHGH